MDLYLVVTKIESPIQKPRPKHWINQWLNKNENFKLYYRLEEIIKIEFMNVSIYVTCISNIYIRILKELYIKQP